MVADQLRRDKGMILDNESSIKAVMENFKEENAELSEVIWQLRLLRVTEILQGKWDDVANSPNSQVVEELRKEFSRLQQELRVKDGRIFRQSAAMDKRTTRDNGDHDSERWCDLEERYLRRVAGGEQEAWWTQCAAWWIDGISAICAPSTSRDSCHSSTQWHESDLQIAESSCIDDISEQHDEHEPDGRFYANPSYEPSRWD